VETGARLRYLASLWAVREQRVALLDNVARLCEAVDQPGFFEAPLERELREVFGPSVMSLLRVADDPEEIFVGLAEYRYGRYAFNFCGPFELFWAENPLKPDRRDDVPIDVYADPEAPHMVITTRYVAELVFHKCFPHDDGSDDDSDDDDGSDDGGRSRSRSRDVSDASDGSDGSSSDDASGSDERSSGSGGGLAETIRALDGGAATGGDADVADGDGFLDSLPLHGD